MKISNEAKVGMLAIVAILALVFGFNFLKGRELIGKSPRIYAVFSNLGTLKKSNEVMIAGYPVGTVHELHPLDKSISQIVVEIRLFEEIEIPKNSVVSIDGSPLGPAYLTIKKGDAPEKLQLGDTLLSRQSGGLLADLKQQVTPTIEKVNMTLDSLKMAISNLNSIFDPSTNHNLQNLIANLTVSSAHLKRLLDTQTGALAGTLNNMNQVTGNLARNNEAVTRSIRNVETLTSNLANAQIKETISALEQTIRELQGAASGIRGSMEKLQDPKGTLGALMTDRKLYDQLNKAALGLEILLDDVRVHPKRYVNISLFGGKGKPGPLTSPAAKDTSAVTIQ